MSGTGLTNYLALWGSVFVALASTGVALDTFLPRVGKVKLYNRLQGWWERVDQGALADVPTKAASWFLRWERSIFGQTRARFLIASFILSVSLTTVGVVVTDAWVWFEPLSEPGVEPLPLAGSESLPVGWPEPQSSLFGSLMDSFGALVSGDLEAFGDAGHPLFLVAGYLLNFVFDTLTLLVTVVLLRAAINQGPFRGLGLIVIDAFIAVLLAVLCGAMSGWLLYDERLAILVGDSPLGTPWSFLRWMKESWLVLSDFLRLDFVAGNSFFDPDVGAYSATSLIPTLFYAGCMASLLIAKPIARFVSPLAAAVLRRLTRENPTENASEFKPFTLLGILLTAVGSILSAVSAAIIVAT